MAIDRRGFVKGLGAAGAVGAFAGLTGPLEAGGQAPAVGEGDFPKPDGLQPGAQLDSRFPVSFQTPVKEGFRLLTDYFTALNRRDVRGLASLLHFPFAIYEGREPIVVESEADFVRNPPPSLNGTGRGASSITPGSYDLLESLNVHLYGPVGGAFSLSFNRFTGDGYKQLACDGMYGITNNDGRWAIQLASTIVHEADFIGLSYPDAEQAAIRGDQNYLAQFGYGNEDVLNDPSVSRGSYEVPLPVGWRTASVNFGYGPRERSRDAREGHPMAGWRTQGVRSRLTVSTVSEASRNRTLNTNLPEFIELAGGAVGDYAYTRDRPVRPITIHATHDKAHVLNGYFRYTADGTLISETRGVSIRVYVNGHWSGAGGFGQVTHHDRSNSKG